ncbi:cystatin-M [Leptonychotes weddellii]|uniref:Cystatin-M n=1 Tax=Leptonychotes weddellii TaxID=9713 RepID=A0A7F8RF72_LEPWE|nr:cystatin-M [Leptonychotes weddellii]
MAFPYLSPDTARLLLILFRLKELESAFSSLAWGSGSVCDTLGSPPELPHPGSECRGEAQAPVLNVETAAPALHPQLVAGIKYYLTVEMGSTACRKNVATGDRVDITTCPLATGVQEEKLRCDFEILVVPWENSSQLLKHNCVTIP